MEYTGLVEIFSGGVLVSSSFDVGNWLFLVSSEFGVTVALGVVGDGFLEVFDGWVLRLDPVEVSGDFDNVMDSFPVLMDTVDNVWAMAKANPLVCMFFGAALVGVGAPLYRRLKRCH